MRDLKASTVIAAIALFIVIGGTATAASGLISGKKIKPGTVTAKQIKNKTITKAKLAPSAVKSLKGAAGETGPAGAKGATGVAGATGATGPAGADGEDGTVTPFETELINFGLPKDEYPVPLSLDVPAGNYLITAKANVVSHDSTGRNTIHCTIWTDETSGVDHAMADLDFNEFQNISMMAVAPVESLIDLRCNTDGGPGAASDLKLIATPVQG